MAMYMLMAKYSATALKAIMETDSDREAMARQAVEAAGGKLHGFYGMFGQEYGLAMIIEAPGHAEYIGGISPAIGSGVFESLLFHSIPGLMSQNRSRSRRKSAPSTDRPGADDHGKSASRPRISSRSTGRTRLAAHIAQTIGWTKKPNGERYLHRKSLPFDRTLMTDLGVPSLVQ